MVVTVTGTNVELRSRFQRPGLAFRSWLASWRFIAAFIQANQAGPGKPGCATSFLSAFVASISYSSRMKAKFG
jgi:hypothetical protein